MALGRAPYTYELVQGWARVPQWWNLRMASDVATNSRDWVYVFNRSEHPLMVFERDGSFLSSWGEGLFHNPHGIYIGPDDSVWLADNYTHVVMKFSPEGKLLLTLGRRDTPSETYQGKPFNMPTGIAMSAWGEVFVADGYGNKRVHKFSPEGELLLSWGEPGTGPGQFNLVHNVAVDSRGRVYVCDRHNNRIQLFDAQGKFLAEWPGLRAPSDIYISREEIAYVSEQGESEGGIGPDRVSIWSLDGKLLSSWDTGGEGRGTMVDPHGIWVDSRGDIYVADILGHTVRKFARVA